MFTLTSLAKKDLFSSPIRVFIGITTIAIGTVVGILCFFLYFFVGSAINKQYTGTAKTDLSVDIYPKFSTGFFRVTKKSEAPLTENLLEEIRQHPGIHHAYAEETLTYPAKLSLALFNSTFDTDSPIYALEDALFKDSQQQEIKNTGAIPVLISKQLVDLYNLGIAQAIKKPQLNEEFLKGWTFDIHLGKSSLFYNETGLIERSYRAEVVGVTDNVTLVGITIPLSSLRHMQEDIGMKKDEYYINKIRSVAHIRDALPDILRFVEEKGFETSTLAQERSQTATQFITITVAFFVGIALIIILVSLSLFLLFWSHVHEKHTFYALLRSQGATAHHIRTLLFRQARYLAFRGMGIGVVLGITTLSILYMVMNASLGSALLPAYMYIIYGLLSLVGSCGLFFCVALCTSYLPYRDALRQAPEHLLFQ